jgi:hypothetical protein
MMTALEQLGSAVASSATPSAAARDLVELHLIDTVGAWIAGARTTEVWRCCAFVPRCRGRTSRRRIRARPRDPLRARTPERDRQHPSCVHDDAGRDCHPAALTLAAATPRLTADDVIAAILAGTEP